ncbi:MAG: hypothetical protein CSYNP_03029 [Syntrophus sp. SKADARSKE-3]|nr:hypothetical protein [Syntrophus sp. SKADARSKE-3]
MGFRNFKFNDFLSCVVIILVLSGCSGNGGGGNPSPIFSTVSGKVTFDSVPINKTSGLVYTNISRKPVRGVIVEAINIYDSTILDSTSTDDTGSYSLNVPVINTIKIRVKAQMLKTDGPSWDFQIVDNTNSSALYVMDSAPFDVDAFDIAGKDLNASSGWGGSAYTGTRVAAPFAILDTVYKAVARITSAAPKVTMPQLLINWSSNNRPTKGDVTKGEINTSHYNSVIKQLYILGKEDVDTDEYDDHIIAHEWGHYFEANFSRSDSLGGSHGSGDKLDPRVAFGEGFGNAFSGMALDDANYVDTKGARQALIGVYTDLSSSAGDPLSMGWFSEDSVQYVLYALYSSSLGFKPIYDVLVNEQKNADSFTTIYSFIAFLKANNPSYISTINNLLTVKKITATAIDQWDSTATETNNGNDIHPNKPLPVYSKLFIGDSVGKMICVDDEFGYPNDLKNRRFIYFVITTKASYTIRAALITPAGIPNIYLALKGQDVENGSTDNKTAGPVTLGPLTLSPGTYVGEVCDYRHLNAANHGSTNTGEVCYNVTLQ